ncbi:FAD:protein FMN transferase [Massilia dura]|uniref:FAD:protein FMN transferase n=1 Tax=Pseudoduganella dura TaxID=321982 RepID=A0A6I3XGY4_9BURK|nr:FAD:protein FMN transferase [Pseudoduganella dura]MUI15757.1 FAD:protein FMN transferase [Pseudoduganella dura]GGX89142.1 FAD:protein FMN transferase [Pseudoduganella dura]
MVERVYRFPFRAMASPCEIRLAAPDARIAAQAALDAIADVQRIEAGYSRYRRDSIVGRINAAAGRDFVECDEETCQLLGYADHLYHASGGLFDITSGVLRRAWDFRQPRLPDPALLAAALALVDWRAVRREGNRIMLPRPGMEIDFGGFGKEYAADRAATLLMRHGVRHGYVNLGGDMRFAGPQPDGQPWLIGIQDPRDEEGTVAGIEVSQGALTTSGDYERFVEIDGRRYCHVLNPRTGMPVSYWRSVSVLAPLAVLGGSVSTIAMLKEEEGLPFLAASGVSYLAIDSAGRTHHHKVSGEYA